jgi:hypothetical protein
MCLIRLQALYIERLCSIPRMTSLTDFMLFLGISEGVYVEICVMPCWWSCLLLIARFWRCSRKVIVAYRACALPWCLHGGGGG